MTLENAIYMNYKNDLSFLLCDELTLYEQQSTYNPNIPLRDLLYVSEQLHVLIHKRDLFGRTLIKIPTPRFAEFYNGKEKGPE